jgi:hypothetical protein
MPPTWRTNHDYHDGLLSELSEEELLEQHTDESMDESQSAAHSIPAQSSWSLSEPKSKASTASSTEAVAAVAHKLASEVAGRVDRDSNGELSAEELLHFIMLQHKGEGVGGKSRSDKDDRPSPWHLLNGIDDVVSYHDVNGDGVVSTDEFMHNFVDWSAEMHAAQQEVSERQGREGQATRARPENRELR